MEKNNKKILIVVSVLLLFGSISFAYFVGTSLFEGTGSKTEAITASIKGATVNVDGGLTFNDLDILPGHQTLSSIKVTATGNNELIPYNLIWNGTNSLNTSLEFKVYKTSKEVDVSASCEKKTKVENGYQILNEECIISNLDKLGSVISSGTIETATNTTKVVLASDEFITATSDGMSVYYYVILEYPNLDEEQNEDMGGNFNGTVTVEESNAKADINILAVKIEEEDGTYKDSGDIPQEGYKLNSEKSVCSNEAIPGWNIKESRFYVDNLTKSGTSCYLYFDKIKSSAEQILENIVVNNETPDFNKIAKANCDGVTDPCEDSKGLYKMEDDDGTSYYFRGAVTNNYVKFADKSWRIVRINGNGSVRLIYNGIASLNQCFSKDCLYGNNAYLGFKYTVGEKHGTSQKSNALNQLESWYVTNISKYEHDLDFNAGFCGDRTTSTSETEINNSGGTGTTTTYYGASFRLEKSKNPKLSCLEEDLYTKSGATKGNKSLTYPIGLITADEIALAGGAFAKNNTSFYLYSGVSFLTMTPGHYNGSGSIWILASTGQFCTGASNSNSWAIRPVINLKADTQFSFNGTGEKGSASNPYIVE